MTDLKKDADSSPWLELCLEQTDKHLIDVSVSDLLQSLTSLKDLVHLLTEVSRSSDAPLQPLPSKQEVRKRFEKSYELICKQTKPGSYVIPVALKTKPEPDEFAENKLAADKEREALENFIEHTLATVSTGNKSKIVECLPEMSNRNRVLRAFDSMSPSSGGRVRVRCSNQNNMTLLYDSDKTYATVSEILRQSQFKPEEQATKETTVIAELEAVDTKSMTFRASTQHGLIINGKLDSEFLEGNSLLTQKHIEIDGTFEIDSDDLETSVINLTEKRLVDDSDITIQEIVVGNETLKADPPLKYTVKYFSEDFAYTLDGDLDLHLFAFSRDELCDMLKHTLTWLWEDYVLVDESKLTVHAVKKRNEIMNRLRLIN